MSTLLASDLRVDAPRRACASGVPVMKEYGEQSFGCLHHVVVLLAKQQAEPAAAVGGLRQRDPALPQEAPESLHRPERLHAARCSCWERTNTGKTISTLEKTAPCCAKGVMHGV